jgi:hypothetical protein
MDFVLERIEKLSPLQVGAFTVCGAVAGYALFRTAFGSKTQGLRLPGPPQDPIIGNLRNFPSDRWYEKFCEWAKLYGRSRFL